MDTNYSSRPERQTGGAVAPAGMDIRHGPGTPGERQAESQRQLQAMGYERMPSGLRIRNLRRALGWTQSIAATELGISVRTVIRHEQGQQRRPWVQLPLLLKLRDLESAYAEEIVAYLTRAERGHPWLPSQQTVGPNR